MSRATHARIAVAGLALCAAVGAQGGGDISFEHEILPFLRTKCFKCHSEPKTGSDGKAKEAKGGLRLDGKAWILAGGDGEDAVVAGDLEESGIYRRVALDADDPDFMPSKGIALTTGERELLGRWIKQGADFGQWTGAAGPDGQAVAASRPMTVPARHKMLRALGEGVSRVSNAAAMRAAGAGAQITHAIPGSPLLRVEFRAAEHAIDDRRVAKLTPLAAVITNLNLSRTRVSDSGLKAIARMQRLTYLDLHGTNISDRGVRHLTKLAELRTLNLYGTKVTDAALLRLASMPNLEKLYVWQTEVSESGLAKLRAAKPDLRVVANARWPAKPQRSEERSNRRRRRR